MNTLRRLIAVLVATALVSTGSSAPVKAVSAAKGAAKPFKLTTVEDILAPISVGVLTGQKSRMKDVEKADNSDTKTTTRTKNTTTTKTKSQWGEISVKLDGMVPTNTYSYKISITMHTEEVKETVDNTKTTGTSSKNKNKDVGKEEPKVDSEAISDEKQLTGQEEYAFEYKTKEFDQVTTKSSTSRSSSGKDIKGYAISIWLNDTLVYEQTPGQQPKYHIVSRR